jgi:hypothetical protein
MHVRLNHARASLPWTLFRSLLAVLLADKYTLSKNKHARKEAKTQPPDLFLCIWQLHQLFLYSQLPHGMVS